MSETKFYTHTEPQEKIIVLYNLIFKSLPLLLTTTTIVIASVSSSLSHVIFQLPHNLLGGSVVLFLPLILVPHLQLGSHNYFHVVSILITFMRIIVFLHIMFSFMSTHSHTH
jgi:hypothetical protein